MYVLQKFSLNVSESGEKIVGDGFGTGRATICSLSMVAVENSSSKVLLSGGYSICRFSLINQLSIATTMIHPGKFGSQNDI